MLMENCLKNNNINLISQEFTRGINKTDKISKNIQANSIFIYQF